jgi:hypothetical protein
MKKIIPFSSLFLIVVYTIFSIVGCGGGRRGGVFPVRQTNPATE